MKNAILALLSVVIINSVAAQERFTTDIRLNQLGFYPFAPKFAVVSNETATDFYIASADHKKVLFNGKLSEGRQSAFSPRKTRHADFSALRAPGAYIVVVPGLGYSHPFEISTAVHHGVAKAALKFFYYQRFSMPLLETHAGKWKRPSSGPHTKIVVHASAATPSRPEGTIIASPRGWIDAGDYNKYSVNSGITTSTLLSAYEDFSPYYDTLNLNIPESKNALPDILDETLWNIRWMLTMQDPDDGGVYHKCTNARFDGMVMPDQGTSARYVVQKGTAATLNFAAVMAQASRVFKRFEQHVPGFADSCLHAAKEAWVWAKKNPAVEYDQTKMNQAFDPDIATGGYGDRNFSDEFIWAAIALTLATHDDTYASSVELIPDNDMPIPSWSQVRLLGYYLLTGNEDPLSPQLIKVVSEVKKRMLQKADILLADVDNRSYRTVMGWSVKDFVWGSSAVAGNQSILLLHAYRVSGEKKYAEYALSNLDYLLGRNATGYSFVTGYGDKTPMHPHHRPSEADGIVEPVPGMLAGGPNPGMQDKCQYPSTIADEAYVDDVCSYASNEVAINWNAPLVYLTAAMEVIFRSGE